MTPLERKRHTPRHEEERSNKISTAPCLSLIRSKRYSLYNARRNTRGQNNFCCIVTLRNCAANINNQGAVQHRMVRTAHPTRSTAASTVACAARTIRSSAAATGIGFESSHRWQSGRKEAHESRVASHRDFLTLLCACLSATIAKYLEKTDNSRCKHSSAKF